MGRVADLREPRGRTFSAIGVMEVQGTGNTVQFFAIDRRSWAAVCGQGLNAAIVYLVMARGSGGDQRTTSWSINAVENYTGVSRSRA
jgi:hypothetical protein